MNINKIYGIIWLQFTQEIQSVLKFNDDYNKKSKTFFSLWLMKKAEKITHGLNINLNKPATLYHTIRSFINMKQDKYEPNNGFKLHSDNV